MTYATENAEAPWIIFYGFDMVKINDKWLDKTTCQLEVVLA